MSNMRRKYSRRWQTHYQRSWQLLEGGSRAIVLNFSVTLGGSRAVSFHTASAESCYRSQGKLVHLNGRSQWEQTSAAAIPCNERSLLRKKSPRLESGGLHPERGRLRLF